VVGADCLWGCLRLFTIVNCRQAMQCLTVCMSRYTHHSEQTAAGQTSAGAAQKQDCRRLGAVKPRLKRTYPR
jgi:hypothetical protein